MATPLTDKINALKSAANETTGASDTTLGDAVATLIAGYGSSGASLGDVLTGAFPTGEIDISGCSLKGNCCGYCTGITKVTGTNVTNTRGGYLFEGCTGITSVNIHFSSSTTANVFKECTNMTTAVIRVDGTNNTTGFFNGCTGLQVADLTLSRLRSNTFYNNSSLNTIILRNTSVTALENTAVMTATSAFKSGGSGGTIYVPSDLISSYQADSNWSVIDGYGTITWAAIEGSIYETQYADGTAIS